MMPFMRLKMSVQSIETISHQERIRLLQIITGSTNMYFADLMQIHFGTTRKSEVFCKIIEFDPTFSDKREEPWEKFFNDYLQKTAATPVVPPTVDIKQGSSIGLLLALTYNRDIN
jgi:hypothetical protein